MGEKIFIKEKKEGRKEGRKTKEELTRKENRKMEVQKNHNKSTKSTNTNTDKLVYEITHPTLFTVVEYIEYIH